MSLKIQYVSFPCKCINIKTIDKDSNKEFVKHKLVYPSSVYCNVIGMEGTFPLACPLVLIPPPFVFVYKSK